MTIPFGPWFRCRRAKHLLFLLLVLAEPRPARASDPAGVVEIDHPEAYSQILALSDVHGMYEPTVNLLTKAGVIDGKHQWVAGKALLIITGDSIDKGPSSVEVLDLWISLSQQAEKSGGRVIHLLGNHEAEFLAQGKSSRKAEKLLEELKKKGLRAKDLTRSKTERGRFLHSMPVAARIGKWFFSHAGHDPGIPWSKLKERAASILADDRYEDALLSGENSVLEAKDWWEDPKQRVSMDSWLAQNGFFGLVQGHQPKAFGIKNRIGAIHSGRWIKLDCGMAPQAGSHEGMLLRVPFPSEMSENKEPHFEVIESDGKSKKLPEYLD